jgi:hypothetical protein
MTAEEIHAQHGGEAQLSRGMHLSLVWIVTILLFLMRDKEFLIPLATKVNVVPLAHWVTIGACFVSRHDSELCIEVGTSPVVE